MSMEHAHHWWVVDEDGTGRLEHNPGCPYLARHEGMFDPQPVVRGYVCDVAVAEASGELYGPRRLDPGRWHVQRHSSGSYTVASRRPHPLAHTLRAAR